MLFEEIVGSLPLRKAICEIFSYSMRMLPEMIVLWAISLGAEFSPPAAHLRRIHISSTCDLPSHAVPFLLGKMRISIAIFPETKASYPSRPHARQRPIVRRFPVDVFSGVGVISLLLSRAVPERIPGAICLLIKILRRRVIWIPVPLVSIWLKNGVLTNLTNGLA